MYPGRELTEIQRNVMRSRKNSSYPHCEDVPTFRKRVVSAIDDILASHVGERVAVVCHGGVIHAVLGEILETSIDYLFSLEHSSISTIRGAGDRKAIFTVNDYAHLQGDERWSS